MKERQIDRLFERFRSRGDVSALGKVFDRTAPELLRVAMSLVPDAADADDLLQSTYLTAIERADRYDGGRRLLPWLLGILVRHAHEKRRDRARVVDPERLAEHEAPDPARVLESQEIGDSLRNALDRLRPKDREVLEPFLREGLSPSEIAVRHGRAPGTVRMQIHRGLERLRKALPASLATGAAALIGERGMAQVRESVLAAGERAGFATAASATPFVLGLATKKLLLGVVTVAALVGISFVLWPDWTRTLPDELALARAETSGSRAALEATVDAGTMKASREMTSSTTPDAQREESLVDDPHAEFLIGMSGRLLTTEDRPLEGLPVQLLEFRASFLGTASTGVDLDLPHFLVDRSTTDAEGRFVLRGARKRTLHILAIDPEGPFAQWRIAGRGAGPGELVSLGDIHLLEPLRLRGRVVDAHGAGVPAARLRAGLLEHELARTDFARYGPDRAFVMTSEPPTFVALPRLFCTLHASYPLSHHSFRSCR